MRIIVDPSTFDCLNMGDVAMLQVAIRRLRRQWPDATIQVFTNDSGALARHCPDTQPLAHWGRMSWFSDRDLLGRLHQDLPERASCALVRFKRAMRRRNPRLLKTAMLAKMRLMRTDEKPLRAFLSALDQADLYVVSGAATMNDKAKAHARVVLATIEIALSRSITVAMFSQGVGPLSDPELVDQARKVLPRVNLICLRESLYGPQMLRALGIQSQKLSMTGDDAVELAYEGRTNEYGDGIGVNLRVGHSSDVDSSVIAELSRILQAAAQTHNAPLIPLPIALHGAADDAKVIRQLCAGNASHKNGSNLPDKLPDEPQQVIAATGRGRIVVTGAYHAAVFALAQGIPAVCLVGNANYREKFSGLADQFGTGCELVELHDARMAQQLLAAIKQAWGDSTQTRPTLLTAAVRQIESGESAYQRLADLFRHTAQTGSSVLQPSSSHS